MRTPRTTNPTLRRAPGVFVRALSRGFHDGKPSCLAADLRTGRALLSASRRRCRNEYGTTSESISGSVRRVWRPSQERRGSPPGSDEPHAGAGKADQGRRNSLFRSYTTRAVVGGCARVVGGAEGRTQTPRRRGLCATCVPKLSSHRPRRGTGMSDPLPVCWNCRRTANHVRLTFDGLNFLCGRCERELEMCLHDPAKTHPPHGRHREAGPT